MTNVIVRPAKNKKYICNFPMLMSKFIGKSESDERTKVS